MDNTLEGDECVEGNLCIIERDTWRAHPPKQKLDPNILPLKRVVIAHTATEACDSLVSTNSFNPPLEEVLNEMFSPDHFAEHLPRTCSHYTRVSYEFR